MAEHKQECGCVVDHNLIQVCDRHKYGFVSKWNRWTKRLEVHDE